jgi:hypothetical protein
VTPFCKLTGRFKSECSPYYKGSFSLASFRDTLYTLNDRVHYSMKNKQTDNMQGPMFKQLWLFRVIFFGT